MQKGKLQDSINLNSYMLDPTSLNLVLPGDLITSESGFMKYYQIIYIVVMVLINWLDLFIQVYRKCIKDE